MHDVEAAARDPWAIATKAGMTYFAIVFAALIHDADHPGVSNETMMREGAIDARCHEGESVLEQHAVDLAWSLLMENTFCHAK